MGGKKSWSGDDLIAYLFPAIKLHASTFIVFFMSIVK